VRYARNGAFSRERHVQGNRGLGIAGHPSHRSEYAARKRGSAEIDGLVASAGESGIETSGAFSYRRKYRQGSLRNVVNRVHHLEC